MIPMSGKPLNEVDSYAPITLLPVKSEIFGEMIKEKKLFPNYQLENNVPPTLEHIHRILNIIEQVLDEKEI